MKAEETPYVSVEPSEISATMARIFSNLRKAGREYTRSANRNMLVLSSGRDPGVGMGGLLTTFAEVHPSRFFVLVQGSEEQRLKVEIAVIGISFSKSDVSCSEVIRISSAPKHSKIVAEIVRSQLLSGLPIELAVFDTGVPREVVERFSAVADTALYDSSVFDGAPDLLGNLVELAQSSVDTQWLVLAPWRDEIRRVFDRQDYRRALPHLSSLSIDSLCPDPIAVPPCAALLAGWIGSRVGHTEVRRDGGERSLRDAEGRELRVSFARRAAALDSVVSRIGIGFGDHGEVVVERDSGVLRTVVAISPGYRSERPLEDESRDAVLRRYFLIGESTANYPSAMRLGLKLR
jgi:hypothetical protein